MTDNNSELPSAERWNELEPLLDAALALSQETRAQFLASLSDSVLRGELEAMIAACERSGRANHPLAKPAAERYASLFDVDPIEDAARLGAAIADRYTIEGEAGRGGMAIVYRAHDLRHQRRVALKVLRATHAAHGLSRFRREIALAANLQHPHIVPVFDSGETEGRLWYTMPFVDGESLGARLRREPRVEISGAVRLVREIADALAHAHARGVVHRDLKPDNVLLSGDHAVIADFGVAKAVAAATHAEADTTAREGGTAFGVSVGTPAYMSPEQAAADPNVDHRADLYALGVIAYQLLSGITPFTGATPRALLAAHLSERPAAVSTHRADVPAELERLVMRLLEKDPSNRPGSASEVIATLDNIAASQSPTTLTISRPLPRGRRSWALALGVVVLVAGLVARNALAKQALLSRRVLVTRLENVSGDTSLAYLGRAAADWIVQGLTKTGYVDVVSDFAEAKTADVAVTGDYYVVRDSIRVQLRIHNATAGTLLTGIDPVTVARAAPDDTLATLLRERVLTVLSPRLDAQNADWVMGALPSSLSAYNEYLKGIDAISQGDPLGAIAHWRRSASLDSMYMQPRLHAAATLSGFLPASADSLLAEVERHKQRLAPGDRALLELDRAWVAGESMRAFEAAESFVAAEPRAQLPYFFLEGSAIQVRRPKRAIEAAELVNVRSGRYRETLAARLHFHGLTEAYHQLPDHTGELRVARMARKLHPKSRDMLGYELRALAAMGRFMDMQPKLDSLVAMPADTGGFVAVSLLLKIAGELAFHGDTTNARKLLRRAGDIDREEIASALAPLGELDRGRVLYFLGKYKEASQLFDSFILRARNDPTLEALVPFYRAFHALSEERLGKPAAGFDTLPRKYDRGVTSYARAMLAAQRGDTTGAIEMLERSLGEGVRQIEMTIENDLMLEPLWKTKRFKELLKPKG